MIEVVDGEAFRVTQEASRVLTYSKSVVSLEVVVLVAPIVLRAVALLPLLSPSLLFSRGATYRPNPILMFLLGKINPCLPLLWHLLRFPAINAMEQRRVGQAGPDLMGLHEAVPQMGTVDP